jgi:hypothetical protein
MSATPLDGRMSLKYVEIDFARNTVYECGAVLLVVLACPYNLTEERSAELHASLCAKAVWLDHLAKPDDYSPIEVKPQYAFRDPVLVDRDVRFVAKRFQRRRIASDMIIPFLQRAALGREPSLPSNIKRLSLNQMAEFVMEAAGQSDANNVERRLFVPSRPVIHLAAAAAVVGQAIHKAGFLLYLEHILLRRELIAAIVREAETFERLIEQDPSIPVKADMLIRVRIV